MYSTTLDITMAKSQSPAKKLRNLKRLITFRKKYRIQHSDIKPTKSNLSICIQTSLSIEPSISTVQQENIKQSHPFTLNAILGIAEDDRRRKKERENEREKERGNNLKNIRAMLSLPPF